MAQTATITAKSGPALQATSLVLNDVVDVDFNLASQTLRITKVGNVISFYDLYGVTTVTYSISSHQMTLTVS